MIFNSGVFQRSKAALARAPPECHLVDVCVAEDANVKVGGEEFDFVWVEVSREEDNVARGGRCWAQTRSRTPRVNGLHLLEELRAHEKHPGPATQPLSLLYPCSSRP
jgi:hypothetical protein